MATDFETTDGRSAHHNKHKSAELKQLYD